MSRFYYVARKSPGETVNGELEAETVDAALRRLADMGSVPLELRPLVADEENSGGGSISPERRILFPWQKKVSDRQLCELWRQLYDLIDAGITVAAAVELAQRSTTHPELKKVLSGIRQRLFSGESLSSAMTAYRETFPSVYIPLVRSGESAGRLPEVLGSLQVMAEKDMALRERIFASLLYPLIVLGVGLLTVFVMLTVLMPRLTVLFEDFGTTLPLPTQLVMGMSRFMASFWWLLAGGFGAVFWGAEKYFSREERRLVLDSFLLRVPFVSGFLRRAETVRVARALAMLVEGGVPLPLALAAALDTVCNTVLKRDLNDVLREVKSGISFAAALRGKPELWPEAAVSMVAVGEATGSMARGLFKLAASLERELDSAAAVFTTVLGPLVLFLVVGVVGVMIAAMLLPLFQMNMMMQ